MEFVDQTGRKVSVPKNPQRIISTVPSQTELLYDLGLENQIVGITAYCVHPRHFLKEKTVIGGTKDLQIEKIKSLRPDLIIGNKEENVKAQIEELAEDFPVWLSDVKNVVDAQTMMEAIGKITGKSDKAKTILKEIATAKSQLSISKNKISTAYFIWKNPWMVASGDTFISKMMNEAGFQNIYENDKARYPEISLENLKSKLPQQIFLSSEPYAFTTKDAHFFKREFPKATVKIVDGELFSWYGSRMVKFYKMVLNSTL